MPSKRCEIVTKMFPPACGIAVPPQAEDKPAQIPVNFQIILLPKSPSPPAFSLNRLSAFCCDARTGSNPRPSGFSHNAHIPGPRHSETRRPHTSQTRHHLLRSQPRGTNPGHPTGLTWTPDRRPSFLPVSACTFWYLTGCCRTSCWGNELQN